MAWYGVKPCAATSQTRAAAVGGSCSGKWGEPGSRLAGVPAYLPSRQHALSAAIPPAQPSPARPGPPCSCSCPVCRHGGAHRQPGCHNPGLHRH
jgi:hypothetical protein